MYRWMDGAVMDSGLQRQHARQMPLRSAHLSCHGSDDLPTKHGALPAADELSRRAASGSLLSRRLLSTLSRRPAASHLSGPSSLGSSRSASESLSITDSCRPCRGAVLRPVCPVLWTSALGALLRAPCLAASTATDLVGSYQSRRPAASRLSGPLDLGG